MTAGTGDAPLDRIAGATGPGATAAFKALSSEIRLAILIALWEAYEPPGDDPVAFSALRERVGTADSGQFNYHLDRLTDHFVRQTGDGYALTAAGHQFVRAIVAGTGLGEATLPPQDVDLACNRCGASPVSVAYHDEAVHLTCGACEGFVVAEPFPEGLIAQFAFEPAGLASRDALEVLAGAWVAENNRLRSLLAGVCPACSGIVETSLLACEAHAAEPGEVCRACGRRDAARLRHVCEVCKYWNEGPAQSATIGHPAVDAFFHDHGVDLRVRAGDVEAFERVWSTVWAMDHAVVSTDPVAVEVTVPCGGDVLRLVLDDRLDVVEIERSG